LPHVESGLFVFIGATTENPGFEVNGALLSRAQVFRLAALGPEVLSALLQRGLAALGSGLQLTDEAADLLIAASDGDGRRLLNLLSMVHPPVIGEAVTAEGLQTQLPALVRQFDKGGDAFYDQISALHKSVRGSDPDAALYWLARMLDGGADPRYLARRLIRMAAEDIGLADPRGLGLAIDAAETYERLGSPEGELALAEVTVFLAVAAKSNAVYKAWNSVRSYVKEQGSDPVPDHLRNAPTRLAKSMGHGVGYRYSHDDPEAYSAGQTYFPDRMAARPPQFYLPTARGLEARIAEKLAHLRGLAKK